MHLVKGPVHEAAIARARAFLVKNEPAHNLMLSILAAVEANPFAYGDSEPVLTLVERDEGEVVAVMMQTPPFRPVVSECGPAAEAVAQALAAGWTSTEREAAGVLGPPSIVEALGKALQLRVQVQTPELIMALDTTQWKEKESDESLEYEECPSQGEAFERAFQWREQFVREALPESELQRLPSKEKWRESIVRGQRRIFLSRHAMVGVNGHTPSGVRIGPVFCTPASRRQGHTIALMQEVMSQLKREGVRWLFLYTDQQYAASNALYLKLGFQVVAEAVMAAFQ